jgi:hypothetical protein
MRLESTGDDTLDSRALSSPFDTTSDNNIVIS